MHEHDIDLIMALAEGRLDGEPATEAARQISACDQCRSDLASQRRALEVLTEAPRVYLTAAESARLHAGVRQALRLGPQPSAVPRRPRRLVFGAVAGAAAVLLAVVMAGPALDLLGSQSDDSAADQVALAPAAPEIASDASGAPRAAEEVPAAGAPADGEQGPVPAPSPAPASPAAESAPPVIDAAGLTELKEQFVARRGSTDLTALIQNADAFVDQPPAYTSGDEPNPVEVAPAPSDAAVEGPTCDPESFAGAPAGSTAHVLGAVQFEGSSGILVAYVVEPIDESLLVVLDAASCEVLATA